LSGFFVLQGGNIFIKEVFELTFGNHVTDNPENSFSIFFLKLLYKFDLFGSSFVFNNPCWRELASRATVVFNCKNKDIMTLPGFIKTRPLTKTITSRLNIKIFPAMWYIRKLMIIPSGLLLTMPTTISGLVKVSLRYVVPPQAYLSLINQGSSVYTFNFNEEWIMKYCFYYQYDERKRMAIKRLPGVQPTFMVYNKRDQLVLTQDGNQRQNNDWLFTKYDVFNRPIMTGKYHHNEIKSQGQMQGLVDDYIVEGEHHYYEVVDLTTVHGYENKAFPDITTLGCEVYTVTYYDNYDYANQFSGYGFQSGEITFPYAQATGLEVKGQLTATKTIILPNPEIPPPGGTGYLLSVNYYDVYKRLVQSVTDNHLGGIDIVSNQINFTGDILLTKENHDNGTDNIIVETKFEYDNGKCLTKTEHRINNAPAWTTLSHNKYDELGRVKRKYLHGSSGNSLQTVNYKYNIRDWLTDINDVASLGGDLFGMHLGYTTGVHPQFNGNISTMQWKTNMFGQSNYNFDYDGVNRLISADYTGIGSHNTTYGYDFNGNIPKYMTKTNR